MKAVVAEFHISNCVCVRVFKEAGWLTALRQSCLTSAALTKHTHTHTE